jgi:transposase
MRKRADRLRIGPDPVLVDIPAFFLRGSAAARKSASYATDLKRQIVKLARTGRTFASLAKECGPAASTISRWVKESARYGTPGDSGLTSALREQLAKLRRENRRLKKATHRDALRLRETESVRALVFVIRGRDPPTTPHHDRNDRERARRR